MIESIVHIHDLSFQLYITPQQIQERVLHLGQKIAQDYEGDPPVFVVVLNGAFIFAADLVRATPLSTTIRFVQLSSYQGLSSTGEIEVVLGLKEEEVAGRPLIIIEDVVDTGNTLAWFKEDLIKMKPKSVKIASLLLKPDALQHPIEVDYLGFSIPTEFVIGYGLDYNEGGRDLAGIYQKI